MWLKLDESVCFVCGVLPKSGHFEFQCESCMLLLQDSMS